MGNKILFLYPLDWLKPKPMEMVPCNFVDVRPSSIVPACQFHTGHCSIACKAFGSRESSPNCKLKVQYAKYYRWQAIINNHFKTDHFQFKIQLFAFHIDFSMIAIKQKSQNESKTTFRNTCYSKANSIAPHSLFYHYRVECFV